MRLSSKDIENYLRDYPDPNVRKGKIQDLALDRWIANHCRGTFEGATGVGKSRVGVNAAKRQFEKNPNSIVYVLTPTEVLRDMDWPDEFRKWDAGHLVDKVKFLCHASMDTEIVQGEIDLVIWDECHHATVLNCSFFKNNTIWCIFAFTATLPKVDNEPEKRAILDKLCPSVFQVPLDDAVALHLVSEFEIKVLLFDLDNKSKSVVSGTSKAPIMDTEYNHYQYLTGQIQNCIVRKRGNAKFKWIGERSRFLRAMETRKKITRDIMKHIMTTDKRTLIFCGSIDLCEELCAPNTYHSKSGLTALKEFRAKIRPYLGAVNALNEGQNLPEVDQAIVVQLGSSDRDIIQRIGRLIRYRVGHIGLVVILVAKHTAEERWYKEAFEDFDKKRIKEYYVKPEA